MFVPAPTDEKFAMIQDTLSSYDNILSVSELCRIANVSRSGFCLSSCLYFPVKCRIIKSKYGRIPAAHLPGGTIIT